MNPYLADLELYPFEKMEALKRDLVSSSNRPHVSLALGEPKHLPPTFVVDSLQDREQLIAGLSAYPKTRGNLELRDAIATWHDRRYGINLNPELEILPVNGTREGLFSFGQAILSGTPGKLTAFPNPFYQIYEGAALLRGAKPYYIPSTQKPVFQEVPDAVWQNTELLYICTPNNPSGHTLTPEDFEFLIHRALEQNFVIVSDECYSEIYYDESQPPLGLLESAVACGNLDFQNCVAFNSLSKRSNLPGLRSGFVAGDKVLLQQYYNYRTYHGCAMPEHVQHASAFAWGEEEHVVANRAVYREKFDATRPILEDTLDIEQPQGGFYFWPELPMDDQEFARQLYVRENITVLPGSYLARSGETTNPGLNRIRIALVAPLDECVDSVRRLCDTLSSLCH